MRTDCGSRFGARDGTARAGVIHTAHGPIETPAFIPLATKGSVRGLEAREVAELGYQLILGNTYHLFVSPGPERIAAAGGLHGFMGWERALITDSGGFQVFSLAHGGVANEVKGSGRSGGEHGSKVEITEEGARFRSPRDGTELFISPEVSMQVQAALGSDIALVFDECTPFHADREYTARSTERTHRWLDRCLHWHEREGPARQAVFGIVQGGIHEDLRRESARRLRPPASTGSRSAAPSAATRRRCTGCWRLTAPLLPDEAPKHLLGIGEVDDLLGGIALGLDVFDCAVPTRLARHGVALAPDPRTASASTCARRAGSATATRSSPAAPVRACQRHDRDYISYLSRAEELTAVRLIVLHNLTYMHELTDHARTAIAAGRFDDYRAAVLAGAPPWDA